MADNNKQYPPELRIDFDPTEPSGLRKVKAVPKQTKVGESWQPRSDGATKNVATAVNIVHVVLPYKDAYKDREGKFPVVNFGAGPQPSVGWRFYVVGPVARDDDGAVLTKAELPVLVSWNDRTDGFWAYDMMTRVITETLGKYPGTNVRDHVFEFGKKAGRSPNGTFTFSHAGLRSEMYPNIAIPEPAPSTGGSGGASQPRQQRGPSEALLRSLPEGVKLPTRNPERQAATPGTTASGNAFALDLSPPTPVNVTNTPNFQPTEQELLMARLMNERLEKQGVTLSQMCAARDTSPRDVILRTFTSGNGRDPVTNEPLSTTAERAAIIAANPALVGIRL